MIPSVVGLPAENKSAAGKFVNRKTAIGEASANKYQPSKYIGVLLTPMEIRIETIAEFHGS